MIPSEDNIRKTSVFVFLTLRAYVYAYALVKTSLKDVRDNCLCASLLRTQFMSQRHAMSCTKIWFINGVDNVN